jgi:tetratricopeptide (TPR) repeat protein
MKKILIALAVLASVQVVNAQTSVQQITPESAAKAIESAQKAADNAKKATKPATWLKLAQAYVNAYDAPAGNAIMGSSEAEVKLMMGNEKPTSKEQVQLNGAAYVKETFANKNLYFSGGKLAIIEVTKPVVEEPLEKAFEAYKKAAEVDSKGSKSKDIANGLKVLNQKFVNEAYNKYGLGDMKSAERYFELARKAMAEKPLSQIDTFSIYNSGFIAQQLGDYQVAKDAFDECLKIGYYSESGEVYSRLAECVTKLDTTAAGKDQARQYLEEGFTKFPESQSILIGLINYYVSTGTNTDKLFDLLAQAKEKDPKNASIYYVEGNVHAQLGETDKAIASYEECSRIDPNYEYGYIGEGLLYFNQAVELEKEAQNELDDKKYVALVQEFEKTLKKCVDPFEKAIEITKDDSVKTSIASYLKNICYRLQDDPDPKYKEGYEKYSAMVK